MAVKILGTILFYSVFTVGVATVAYGVFLVGKKLFDKAKMLFSKKN